MKQDVPPDIRHLYDQIDANERDAEALVAGLSEEQGTRRPEGGGWCIAECLDHLATGNRVYLRSMQESADRARARGRERRGPAKPGFLGGLFARSLEPPPKWWSRRKTPRKARPRVSPPLGEAFADFMASHRAVREFLDAYAHLDLAEIRFRNPFVRTIYFSLATGLHVTTAHERRHLWQAWNVRRAMDRGTPTKTAAG